MSPAADPRESARAICRMLRRSGFQALLVGGCVRDLILGLAPKDFDVATDATPSQLLDLFPQAHLVGAHFGVIMVNGVDVATFRSDHVYVDGRRPERVNFESDAREDVVRRDFTINALLLDPLQPEADEAPECAVIDYVDGLNDLRQGVIRAIGNPERRFEEDHLRMLRAVRFAARFRFAIEPATLAAIQKLHRSILRVSPERIRGELIRILTEGGARYGFELLDETGLLNDILPEIAAMKGVQQAPEHHPEGDVWTHTLIMLEGLRSPTPALAMGVLLHDVGKPSTFQVADRIRFNGHVEAGEKLAANILKRLRLSNSDCEQILALIANHMRFKDVPQMRESTLKRFLRLDRFNEHLALHRLDCLASHGHLEIYEAMKERAEALPPEVLRPPRVLTGQDLIAHGYAPGPSFTPMLELAEDAQLEGRAATTEEALELVRTHFGPPGNAATPTR